MEVEKQGVKGGFFQLFDWNSKSRKKLFSSKSELPESSNQGKENFYNSAIERHRQVHEFGARSHNDYHYASSENNDSEYGTKAPGVVARLMGLDSLPKSTVNEPSITPFVVSHSFRDSNYIRNTPAFQTEHDIVIFESVRNKLDGLTRNPLERFQSEVLPPKSAKPISVTHNRLLSPIKSPGFIPPKNAAYIIEQASKIIEHSPRANNKGKLPSIGSSSIPFRVRDLKEKMEAAQRSYQNGKTSQNINEPSSVKKKRQSEGIYSYKGSEESKRIDSQRSRSKSKEKSLSHASQAKNNIQKKDGSTSVGHRTSDKQKECNEMKPSCDGRNVINTQKKKEKQISSRRPSEVLKPNHQKQNSASGKVDDSFSLLRGEKESNPSNNYVYGRPNRTVNKIVLDNELMSRKINLVAADPGKELLSSRTKTNSKKKQPINRNDQIDGTGSRKAVGMKNGESVTCNATFEGDSKWDTIDKKNGSDVVSFAFRSPIKKSGTRSNNSLEADLSSSAVSSSGFNFIGGDSLSVLLEQKLKELASRVESCQQDFSESGSFSSSFYSNGKMGPAIDSVNSLPVSLEMCKGKQEMGSYSDYPSIGKFRLNAEIENKGQEYMEKDGNNNTVEQQGKYNLLGSGSASSLPSFSGASTYSYDVDSSSNESSMQCLSLESYKGINTTKKSHPIEGDTEISDTASSLSVTTTISETVTSTVYMTDSKDSSYWELQYISDIVSSGSLMVEDFALGQSHKVIAPELFAQLENRKIESNKGTEERFLLARKVLFDCVNECLEARSGRALDSGWAYWSKNSMMLRKKEWLAEEIYREISNWMNDEELMVDELVEKDMSCKNGKWVEFEVEGFEEGVEIEKRILTSLVDEVIDDFLF